MSRLTMKLDEPIKTKYLNYEYNRIPDYDIVRGNFGRISDDMIFNKLGKLEDLEDELGCPLEVVFKVLKEGILVNDIKFTINGEESSKTIFREIIFTYNKFYKDYGFGFGMDENGNNPLWWISLKDCQKFW